jgi:hypothetical protein
VAELGIPTCGWTPMIGRPAARHAAHLDLARALAVEPDVLLLDEMTAALPTDLVDRVLTGRARAGRCGPGVIYISHRFTEIAAICDRATVLRDGPRWATCHRAGDRGADRRADAGRPGSTLPAHAPGAAAARRAETGPPRLRVTELPGHEAGTMCPSTCTRARCWASSRWRAGAGRAVRGARRQAPPQRRLGRDRRPAVKPSAIPPTPSRRG